MHGNSLHCETRAKRQCGHATYKEKMFGRLSQTGIIRIVQRIKVEIGRDGDGDADVNHPGNRNARFRLAGTQSRTARLIIPVRRRGLSWWFIG